MPRPRPRGVTRRRSTSDSMVSEHGQRDVGREASHELARRSRRAAVPRLCLSRTDVLVESQAEVCQSQGGAFRASILLFVSFA